VTLEIQPQEQKPIATLKAIIRRIETLRSSGDTELPRDVQLSLLLAVMECLLYVTEDGYRQRLDLNHLELHAFKVDHPCDVAGRTNRTPTRRLDA
jgi:hypothetical protein